MLFRSRALLRFLSDVYLNSYFASNSRRTGFSHISCLGDIGIQDVKYALQRHKAKDQIRLRRGLLLLAHPIVRKFLGPNAELWLLEDIRAMHFKKSTVRQDYEPVMPTELFQLISRTGTNDIGLFLESVHAPRAYKGELDRSELPEIVQTSGNDLFDDYVAIRSKDRRRSVGRIRKAGATSKERKVFKSTYGIQVKEYMRYVMRVKLAAEAILAQYTGGRFSDLISFKQGCVEQRDDYWLLKGTVVKGVDLTKPCGNDVWPAIPVMRDAVTALELISLITFDPYLFSNMDTKREPERHKPISLNGFTSAMNWYLQSIDASGRWKEWRISTHQFRHSLANQLARADLGIIYISIHMHHLYTALRALPPDATLAYGNISDLKQERAMYTGAAYLEVSKALYDPDQPVAGGGAEEYMKRRKEYFAGMQAEGWTKDEIIAKLSKQGLPFASVGAAYCGGRREIVNKDGSKEKPPCMGSLQCNPVNCKQAVITRVHAPIWQKVRKHNHEMGKDPRFSYAKDTYERMAAVAESVDRKSVV